MVFNDKEAQKMYEDLALIHAWCKADVCPKLEPLDQIAVPIPGTRDDLLIQQNGNTVVRLESGAWRNLISKAADISKRPEENLVDRGRGATLIVHWGAVKKAIQDELMRRETTRKAIKEFKV